MGSKKTNVIGLNDLQRTTITTAIILRQKADGDYLTVVFNAFWFSFTFTFGLSSLSCLLVCAIRSTIVQFHLFYSHLTFSLFHSSFLFLLTFIPCLSHSVCSVFFSLLILCYLNSHLFISYSGNVFCI